MDFSVLMHINLKIVLHVYKKYDKKFQTGFIMQLDRLFIINLYFKNIYIY